MTSQDAHPAANVKCTHVDRGMWLVKVPRYLSDKWEQSVSSSEVGRLRVMQPPSPGAKPEILFMSTGGIGAPVPQLPHTPYARPGTQAEAVPLGGKMKGKDRPMPKEHRFVVAPVQQQTLAILREDKADPSEPAGKSILSVDGKVIQRADCRPMGDATYMKMKMGQIEDATKPKKAVIQVGRAEVKFKPVARHAETIQAEKDKKEGNKLVRQDRHQVQELIFRAFQQHQYYNIKDLCAITQQPYTFLKEILNDICLYNTAPPHRSMWELKPEYRHY